jgi:hypothetical protein
VSGRQKARKRRKQMKTNFLTIALAVPSLFAAQQPAAAKSSSAAKTTAATKKHHKKHMKKTADTSTVAVKDTTAT